MFKWLRKNKRPATETPAFWKNYQKAFDQEMDRNLPIEEATFVVFDTETTGLNTKKDRILSIGAVKVCHWQIDLSNAIDQWVEQPNQSGGAQSIPIHGILPVERANSLTENKALEIFLQYIGNAILVGHHVSFDIAMIQQALQRVGLGKLKNRYLDTGQLANRVQSALHPGPKRSPGLDELCREYHIPPVDRHTAAGDAFITAILLMKLLAKLQKRKVRNLKDLLR